MATLNPLVEGLDEPGLVALQERRVLETLRRVYATNAFYRRYYDELGVDVSKVQSLADYAAMVPTIDKKTLLADQADEPPFGTRARGRVQQIHLTSGTSGLGQEVHALTEGDVLGMGTLLMYQWRWAGLDPGDLVALTLPWGTTMAGPYFDEGTRALGVGMLYLGAASAEQKLELMMRFKPRALLAVPAYLHRLQITCNEMGIDPARDMPFLQKIMTAAEPFSLEWAVRTEQFWKVPLYEWYGASQTAGSAMASCELGVVQTDANGDKHRGVMHSFDHRVLIEVLHPDSNEHVAPGDFGEVVPTVMTRQMFPCLRFRLRDRIRYLGRGVCRCGRAFTAFETGSISRYDDMLKIRGLNVWPDAVDAIVLNAPGVAEYQARVETDEASGREVVVLQVEFLPEIDDSARTNTSRDLKETIKSRVGLSVDITLVEHMSLPRYDFKVRRWTDAREEGRLR